MDTEILSSNQAFARSWQHEGPILVMPFTEPVLASRASEQLARRASAAGLLVAVFDDQRRGFIDIVNRMFSVSESPYFGYLAQDAFAGRHWLRFALNPFSDPACQLVALNDGKWFGAMAAFGVTRTDWARQNYGGDLFYPKYRRHYADAELSLVAAEQKGLRFAVNSVLVEVDWEKDSKTVDQDDRRLFQSRVSNGFDGKVQSIALKERFA
jgi:hypothetical protein